MKNTDYFKLTFVGLLLIGVLTLAGFFILPRYQIARLSEGIIVRVNIRTGGLTICVGNVDSTRKFILTCSDSDIGLYPSGFFLPPEAFEKAREELRKR